MFRRFFTSTILRSKTKAFPKEISIIGSQRRGFSNDIYNTVPQVSLVVVFVFTS